MLGAVTNVVLSVGKEQFVVNVEAEARSSTSVSATVQIINFIAKIMFPKSFQKSICIYSRELRSYNLN